MRESARFNTPLVDNQKCRQPKGCQRVTLPQGPSQQRTDASPRLAREGESQSKGVKNGFFDVIGQGFAFLRTSQAHGGYVHPNVAEERFCRYVGPKPPKMQSMVLRADSGSSLPRGDGDQPWALDRFVTNALSLDREVEEGLGAGVSPVSEL